MTSALPASVGHPPGGGGRAALVALLVLRAWRGERTVGLARQALPLGLRLVVIAVLLAIALNHGPCGRASRRASRAHGACRYVIQHGTATWMGGSRMAAALKVLADGATLGQTEGRFHARRADVRQRLPRVNLATLTPAAAEGRATDLGAALAGAVGDLAERPGQAGVLLVSDGRATTDGATEAARLALARSVPVWTWCLGGDVARRDLWIDVPGSEFSRSRIRMLICRPRSTRWL